MVALGWVRIRQPRLRGTRGLTSQASNGYVNSLASAHGTVIYLNRLVLILPLVPRYTYPAIFSNPNLSRSLFQRVFSTMAEATQLVYQRDGERLLHSAKVISIVPVSELAMPDKDLIKDAPEIEHAIITDSTIFHVQGGGQPSDTGIMAPSSSSDGDDAAAKDKPSFQVKSVRHPAQGHQVLHFGHFIPPGGASAPFPSGTSLQQHVDAEKRNLHSRLHSAGHILSLAIYALCASGELPPLKESKASHYPDSASVGFHGTLEAKHKDAIQAKTDEFVKSARPIRIHWWPMDELLEKCHGTTDGFALPDGETMGRVVEMEGLGSYPCGGTHVSDCSLVGRIEVKKISRSKGTTKVSYRVA
ncbi:hypothetical protein ACJBU6_10653 [Exserohilum turcicum]